VYVRRRRLFDFPVTLVPTFLAYSSVLSIPLSALRPPDIFEWLPTWRVSTRCLLFSKIQQPKTMRNKFPLLGLPRNVFFTLSFALAAQMPCRQCARLLLAFALRRRPPVQSRSGYYSPVYFGFSFGAFLCFALTFPPATTCSLPFPLPLRQVRSRVRLIFIYFGALPLVSISPSSRFSYTPSANSPFSIFFSFVRHAVLYR